jgi:hypothetical protein
MFRSTALVALALFSVSSSAATAPPSKPVEVKVLSLPAPPPAQPTEVKITSMPAASPAEVRIVAAPENPCERSLVLATWWLIGANMLLCVVTFLIGRNQRRDMSSSIAVAGQAASAARDSANAADRSATSINESVDVTKRQERAAVEREVNRAAHKVMYTAKRLEELAKAVPVARTQLHILSGQGGLPPELKAQTAKTLEDRLAVTGMMFSAALAIVDKGLTDLADKDLTAKLWRLDEHQVQLDAMREAITHELDMYEGESQTRRNHNVALQAALAGKSGIPPKSTLGT